MAENKRVLPLWFRKKALELAKGLEIEHDGMICFEYEGEQEPSDKLIEELGKEAGTKVWDEYAEIEGRLWNLIGELEDLAAEGPVNEYGHPVN